jgi:hypothetical protein
LHRLSRRPAEQRTEDEMTKRGRLVVAMALTLSLGGCMGAGLLARIGAKHLFGEKEKPPAERIALLDKGKFRLALQLVRRETGKE